jgi:hypothetical protein
MVAEDVETTTVAVGAAVDAVVATGRMSHELR